MKLTLTLIASLASLTVATPALAAKAAQPPRPDTEPNWGHVRTQVEEAILKQLVDPESARIEWPYGFKWGGYKVIFSKRVFGWTSCVMVNGRNRMGGYTGSKPAVVVYLDGVQLLTMLDDQLGIDSENCAKAGFPSPPPALTGRAAIANPVLSVADEIAKLAALRDKGIITAEEFQAQKVKLLGVK
jgi:hypothetical protein